MEYIRWEKQLPTYQPNQVSINIKSMLLDVTNQVQTSAVPNSSGLQLWTVAPSYCTESGKGLQRIKNISVMDGSCGPNLNTEWLVIGWKYSQSFVWQTNHTDSLW
jgi:hypothetical protein